MRKISLISLIVSIFIVLVIAFAVKNSPIVDDCKLNYYSYQLDVGEMFYLQATATPSNAKFYVKNWESSNQEIAEVDKNGRVISKGVGECVITANLNINKTLKCIITVNPIQVTSIDLITNFTTLAIGQIYPINATIAPQNATYKDIVYTTTNENVAKVNSNNALEAVGVGTATITATAVNGVSKSIDIKVVQEILPVSISLESDFEIRKNITKTLYTSFYPSNATQTNLTYTNSNPEVVSIDENGKVIALKGGTATITAVSDNGCVDTCTITVTEIKATGLIVQNLSDFHNLHVGDSVKIKIKLHPYNSTDTLNDIEFVSLDTSVATVSSSGIVTVVGAGATHILFEIDGESLGMLYIFVI